MDANLLKILGSIAGIGGIAVGTLLILYREIIRKRIFPNLTKEQAYKLFRLMLVLVWSVALVGVGAWVYVTVKNQPQNRSIPDSVRFYGIVIDKNGSGVGEAEIEVFEQEGESKRIGVQKTKPNGEFNFIVKAKPEETIWVTVKKENHIGFQGYLALQGNQKIPFK